MTGEIVAPAPRTRKKMLGERVEGLRSTSKARCLVSQRVFIMVEGVGWLLRLLRLAWAAVLFGALAQLPLVQAQSGPRKLAVIGVPSRPEDHARRDVIRRTWARALPPDVEVLFILGDKKPGDAAAAAAA
jgi:hypothetical protein